MMPGVIKTTTLRQQTHRNHPIQSAAPNPVFQRTSKKTDVVERNIGIADIQNLLEELKLHPGEETALHLNGSQALVSACLL
jgi:hypothetical protein